MAMDAAITPRALPLGVGHALRGHGFGDRGAGGEEAVVMKCGERCSGSERGGGGGGGGGSGGSGGSGEVEDGANNERRLQWRRLQPRGGPR